MDSEAIEAAITAHGIDRVRVMMLKHKQALESYINYLRENTLRDSEVVLIVDTKGKLHFKKRGEYTAPIGS